MSLYLVKPGTRYEFVGKRKLFAMISGLMVLASILGFTIVGPVWGIEFTGGSEVHLQFERPVEIGEVRGALTRMGLSDDAVQAVGKNSDKPEFIVRVLGQSSDSTEDQKAVLAALEGAFNAGWVQESSVASEVGSRMTIRYGGDEKPIAEIESVLAGIQGIRVSPALDEKTFYVQFASLDQALIDELEGQLSGKSFKVLSNETVGPKVGGDLKTQGFVALTLTLGLILVYVAFRFDLAFAPGAVLSLFHDVWIVIGVFVLFRKEFNVQMIGALLTIIGYSLNDTIVIYDRIRENMRRYRRKDLMQLINDSMNETLGRTISTSITTMLAMLPFLIFGGAVIRDFAIAMVIGIFAGCYSTIYVAAPMILLMEDLKPVLGRWIAPFSLAAAGEKKDGGSGVAS